MNDPFRFAGVDRSSETSRRRWWALAALVPGVLAIGFDVTILNVGLPTIASELSAGTGALQWIVTAYVLVFAGFLLPAGVVGDRLGRKRLLLTGLALLGAASLLATTADDVGVVIAARAVMGLGAALILPLSLAVVPVLFPEEQARRKAVALLVMGVLVGLPLGPIVGGYLLDHFFWGSIFLINVPIVLVAIAALAVLLPESRDPNPPRADLIGGLLSTAGLVTFVYGVIEAPERGWGVPLVLTALVAGLLLLAAFVWWELRNPEPLIDLGLFRRGAFAWGSAVAVLRNRRRRLRAALDRFGRSTPGRLRPGRGTSIPTSSTTSARPLPPTRFADQPGAQASTTQRRARQPGVSSFSLISSPGCGCEPCIRARRRARARWRSRSRGRGRVRAAARASARVARSGRSRHVHV